MAETSVTTSAAKSSKPSLATQNSAGLQIQRLFTRAGEDPYAQVEWDLRLAQITDSKGKVIFEQRDVETPKDWSMTATNIVASKYLHGALGTSERESGVRALISRVADTITRWGKNGQYFRSDADAIAFHDELVHILVQQKCAFNSPVWFNVGCDKLEPTSAGQNWHWNPNTGGVEFSASGYKNPQCSACFINSVEDSLDSILTLAKTEGMLFKWGSGTGSNLSPIRSSNEQLSGGGTASGPLSFMRGFDAFAGVIKSGGKTRRAAKMVILNIDHPDIVDFIECKMKEEAKAHTLVAAGYDGSGPDSEAFTSIFFQNANNSVRVTDEFMHAVERDAEFTTRAIKDGAPVQTFKARDLLAKIAEATWHCGDPGMQYDTIINKWHTSKNTARINASNPCSEYMFLDDSACNLASLNLMKFVDAKGQFDIAAYRHAVDITITAQEILVDNSGYPTEAIARNSHDYRPLGLGYANLGALLMALGLPYDSPAGRDLAGTVTAIMCGEAYLQSARIAAECPHLAPATTLTQKAEQEGGACPGFYPNREPFLDVVRMHRASVNNVGSSLNDGPLQKCHPERAQRVEGPMSVASSTLNQLPALIAASKTVWDEALALGERAGYRNAQVTVLAPTGTIGFMMDCDTTGVEPDLALVKYKKLVGGGMIKIVNNTVPSALFKLGYAPEQVDAIVSYIDATGTIEGAPHIKDEHLPVFDCSFKPSKGTRSIHYMGHILMMAAAQPFLSGAISKTVNMPTDATVEDIAAAYLESWRQGIKAVAIYRDGSKGVQPLNVSNDTKKSGAPSSTRSGEGGNEALIPNPLSLVPDSQDPNAPPRAVRHRLSDERASVTHKFSIAGHDGYITVGLYPNGQPGEIFIKMAKEGSTVSGLMDAFATSISLSLQHGVPLKVLCEKFAHLRFEPSGWTQNAELGYAKSIMDYIFRWLQLRFLSGQQLALFAGLAPAAPSGQLPATSDESPAAGFSGDRQPEAGSPRGMGCTSAPQGALPSETNYPITNNTITNLGVEDRGVIKSIHASDAMREFVDMGDAPSCHVCGAIMTRNGSCYRCMSCGSTSGCS